MKHKIHPLILIPVISIILFTSIILSSTIGTVDIPTKRVFHIILSQIEATSYSFLPGIEQGNPRYQGPSSHQTIVIKLRLPRIIVAAIVGFALGAVGAVMQGFFRNPMADPQIIGVSSGAAVGAVAVITLPFAFPLGITSAAFIGALIAAFTVYLLATKNGKTGVATLLLAGIAVQMLLSAIISLLIYRSDNDSLRQAVFWLMGNLVNREWWHVHYSLPVVVIGVGALWMYSRELNIMVLGEEEAHNLGVRVERTKRILLAICSLVTAAAVAVSGVIGFVGLIIPHMMRLLIGPDHKVLIPISALGGALFLVLADNLARTAFGVVELPVGIVTALVGVPFFLYLLRKREVYEL